MKKIVLLLFLIVCVSKTNSQNIMNNPTSNHGNKFEQLGTILPTPNEYRTASGAPGNKYWQQRADYDIKCELDETNYKLKGSETITYFNNSPDALTYLWLQLDENEHSNIKNANYQSASTLPRGSINSSTVDAMAETNKDNGYGINITSLTNTAGNVLKYTINKTMMRVDLQSPLKPGQQVVLKINWNYKLSNVITMGGRGGYEFFLEDGNALFTMSQWYPRLCVYSDFQGWQNHQFTGGGEFALVFGNFKVAMTVPADHIIMATGECTNYASVLTSAQQQRWTSAQKAKEPVEVVTLAEAKAAEKQKSTSKKTWIFAANNVRDFAWGSSRKFIWDAFPTYVEGKKIMCMSAYGKEAYGLYRKFSSKAVAHTIRTYSKFTIPYPYPVAQSIEASSGMEYPMICFNYGRTEKDGTYTENAKNGMLGVIIHEVGHNFFPMIINSDERQWTWMDEGLNSFMDYITKELYDNKFPSRRGPAYTIADYMKLPKDQLEPIMTNSENIVQFGSNAYGKPSTALNILRETVMGRELFDFAFKEYARRWAFKHPTPADFFRTIEDASGEDLDWFWRGWFYSIEPCDISIDSVRHAIIDSAAQAANNIGMGGGRRNGFRGFGNQDKIAKPSVSEFDDISKVRNRDDKKIIFLTDADTSLRDFYWKYERGIIPYDSTVKQIDAATVANPLVDAATKLKYQDSHLYEISFSNKGGLVMPIIVEFKFEDGTTQTEKIPAQVWRLNENKVTKLFMTTKKAIKITLDPMRETADINESNNTWPKVDEGEPSKLQLFKTREVNRRNPPANGLNPMQAFGNKN